MPAAPFEPVEYVKSTIEGGNAESVYTSDDVIDGGNAESVYTSDDIIDGGTADRDLMIINTNCSKFIIYTNNKYKLQSYCENTERTDRCTLDETPCGGIKNHVPDMYPGTLSISGEGCYLKNPALTYLNKHLSAGQLAEKKEITTSGSVGCAFKTADGKVFRTMDNKSFLVTPPNTIVSRFIVQNISDTSQTYTITVRCPDAVNSIKLYDLDTLSYKNVTLTNVQQSFGAINSYTFSLTSPARSSKSLQVMIEYSSLGFTFRLSNDAFSSTGLHNMEGFVGYYDASDTEMNFILFTQTPEYITCVHDAAGTITQITFPRGTGTVYRGSYAHTGLSRLNGTDIPDCLNPDIMGSLSMFLRGHRAISVSDATITTYVLPAISDEKILPRTTISDSFLSNVISKRLSPGEYGCASFVIKSDKAVNLSFVVSDLFSGLNKISKENIKLRYVKCWWVGGNSKKSTHPLGCFLSPELLLYDDSLVQSSGDQWTRSDISNPTGRNYIKLDGEYVDISDRTPVGSASTIVPIADMPIYDAAYLQTLYLSTNYNKQIWVTPTIPLGTKAGTYSGTITILSGFKILKTVEISIQVLPIIFPALSIKFGAYYRPKLTALGSISSEQKNAVQYTAELQNIAIHGLTEVTCYTPPSDSTLDQVLSLRQQYLPNSHVMYMLGRTIKNITTSELSNLISACSAHGMNSVYIYGYDEASMNTPEIRAQIQAVHDAGAKVFCAQSPTQALAIKDVLDLAIGNSTFTMDQIETFQATGHDLFSYGNPQSVPEFPRTFRLNYGLHLWQYGYKGMMVYAFQHNFGPGWNEFGNGTYRNHYLTYPTANGCIDTIQWEGLSAGIWDIKYLDALQAAISAHPGTTATAAANWLNSLKTADLSLIDLDGIRDQMINYILILQGE